MSVRKNPGAPANCIVHYQRLFSDPPRGLTSPAGSLNVDISRLNFELPPNSPSYWPRGS